MHIRTLAAAIALAGALFSTSAIGKPPPPPPPPPPVAQSNPWPDQKPDYIQSCRHALQTALDNQNKASAANADLVAQLIGHARDSQAKGDTFQCLNEAQEAIAYEK